MHNILYVLIAFLVFMTGCLSLKMFSEKKKGDKDWSVWANLISAAGTVVVGVATIFVMFQENSIQTRLAKMQEAEHQPIIVVKEVGEKSEGSDVYDYEEFHIYNYGEVVKSIDSVKADAFVRIEYRIGDKRYHSYAPISDYYYRYYSTGALQGDIAHSYGSFKTHNRYLFVNRLYNTQDSRYEKYDLYFGLVKTYKVEYTDIYDERKAICFIGESETSIDNYQSIYDRAFQDFHGESFNLEEDSIDAIMKYLID